MNRLLIVKILSFLVMIAGVLVMFGWIFDIGILKSISPNMATMKFTTALCFIASGVVLYSATQKGREDSFMVQAILPSAILFILLLMVTLLISSIFGFNIGLDSFFIQEKAGAVNTVIPGRPSIPTMINFTVITLAGISILANFKKSLAYPGSIILLIGSVAALGYIFNQPVLYYLIPGINTAMALNTAMLFILIGIGFILCGKTPLKQN